ncbi:MAG: guanine deaminase [Betaproteobacteria bacterium]|nr:guanine deaminase [Betaproteobacteria bacterium]
MSNDPIAYHGAILHFVDDPGSRRDPGRAMEFYPDGLLVVRDGRIESIGDRRALKPWLTVDTAVVDYGEQLILPGFVDTHVHYAQTDIIASYGTELLDWLERFAFPAERAFTSGIHSREVADFFLKELLRNGTTTAMVFATVHRESVDAIFAAAQAARMRIIAGKIMMDRHCPEWLRDTPESSYEDAKALIERWHGKDRLAYAITPRFAPTSSEAQLDVCRRLADEHSGVFIQSHLAENHAEVAWMKELFPSSRSYLDVYDRFGLLRPRAVYAHSIHIDEADRARMAASGAAASFCPTSNLFLGSGLFDFGAARDAGVHVGIGTDVGGGISFSMLRTLAEGYKVVKLAGNTLSPWRALYTATLGGARALGLEANVGSLAPGRDADFIVLDPNATPLIERRMAHATTLEEKLFAMMMLGDDRAIAATYVMGECAHGLVPEAIPRVG